MINQASKNKIEIAIYGLVGLDIVLPVVAFFFPNLWFNMFHGIPYSDPEGLLRRCGANWAAFALFQLLGLLKWKKQPVWLVIIAGLRFSDIFTDWTYLLFAQDITWFGKLALSVSSPANLLLGLFFMHSYKKVTTIPRMSAKISSRNC